MSKNKLQLVAVLAVIILLAVLIPQNQARAESSVINAINSFATEQVITALVNVVRGWLLGAISFFAKLLDTFIQYQTEKAVFNVGVVNESWTIMRNFVNLFFILILIIMAFGTIFDIKKYTWKEMLPQFLIAALLINFSLAIGQYIITISNGLSGVFLKEIGTVSDRFAQGFSLAKIPTADFTTVLAGPFLLIINAVFSIIFLLGAALAFASAAIFTIARMFALWFLLILSPIAWVGYAMPSIRAQTWSRWWSNFYCWCFFLPFFLFFVMFAVIFIGGKSQFPPMGNVSVAGLVGNDFMFYGMSLIFLFAGMSTAKKMACASGSRVGAVFGAIETGVRKYAPGAAYVRGGVAGLKERGEEIKEKGVFGIGGAQRGRLDEAKAKGWVAGIPGLGQVPGAREMASQAQAAEIEKEAKKIRELNLTLDALNKKLASAKGPELYAIKKVRAENGWNDVSDRADVLKTLRELKGKAQADYVNALDKGDFERLFAGPKDKEDFVKNELVGADLLEAKKKMLKSMAHDREIFDDELMRQTTALFKNEPKDIRDKVMADLQKNVSNVYSDLTKALQSTSPAAPPPEVKRLIAKQLAEKKKIKTYSEYDAVLKTLGEQTADGQDFVKDMKDNNPLMAIEAEMRTGLEAGQFLDNEEFIKKVVEELKKKDFETIRKYSVEFFKDPAAKAAIERTYTPQELSGLLRNAPKSVKIALQDLPGAAQTERGRRRREPAPQQPPSTPTPQAPRIITPPPTTGTRTTDAEEEEARESIARERERILRETGRIP